MATAEAGDQAAMIEAIDHNDIVSVESLLDRGVDPNCVQYIDDVAFATPLTYALARNRDAIVRKLLERGADPRVRLGNNWSAIFQAFKACASPAVIDRLIAAGADLDARTSSGRNVLHYASCAELVAYACARGVDANLRDTGGESPLHVLILGSTDVIVELVNCGADPSARDVHGRTPLDQLNRVLERRSAAPLVPSCWQTKEFLEGLVP